ncbi:hypothetical protein A2U01_0096561, partial [Trifolium medium]|nr:hypothetical protein [Trifolium medium]
CHLVEVIEAVEDKFEVQTPPPPLERGLVDSRDVQEVEWNREIEIFLQRLEDDLEEASKVVDQPSELKELPPKW